MDKDYSKEELDNRSNQLNPNNDAFWKSRGYEEKPEIRFVPGSPLFEEHDDDDDDDDYSDFAEGIVPCCDWED